MKSAAEWKRLGAKLQAARASAGLTQTQVAARLGCDQATVSRAETGVRRVTAVLLARLAILYGTTSDDLLAGTGSVAAINLSAGRRVRRRDDILGALRAGAQLVGGTGKSRFRLVTGNTDVPVSIRRVEALTRKKKLHVQVVGRTTFYRL